MKISASTFFYEGYYGENSILNISNILNFFSLYIDIFVFHHKTKMIKIRTDRYGEYWKCLFTGLIYFNNSNIEVSEWKDVTKNSTILPDNDI